MSLDNVLAVAGAAREHPFVLIFGLLPSVALMALPPISLGQLLQKLRWMTYVDRRSSSMSPGIHELAPVIASP